MLIGDGKRPFYSQVKSRLKIAFLSAADPHDTRAWSGTSVSMARSLQEVCGDIDYLGPVDMGCAQTCMKISSAALELVSGKKYDCDHNPWLAKKFGEIFTKKIRKKHYDFIFAPAASTEIAYVDTKIPIIYLSDSTFARMIDYYPSFTGLLEISKRHGLAIERAAIQKAGLLLYPSNWARKSAIEDFGAPSEKTQVVPFGANLDDIPAACEVVKKKRSNVCRLLFLAVDWQRKGGQIAYDTFKELNRRNIPTELTVCGCIPPKSVPRDNINIVPFLNKGILNEKKRLIKLFMDSDFLILPTRAECAGIVFCEASAFGVPSITTDTGGISDTVFDQINGCLLSPSAAAGEYADRIADIFLNESTYNRMRRSSREQYENRLNWTAWAESVDGLVHNTLAKTREVSPIALTT